MIAKQLLTVAAAELIVMGTEPPLKKPAERAEQAALEGGLRGIVRVGRSEDKAAERCTAQHGGQRFAEKARLGNQCREKVRQHAEDTAVLIEVVLGVVKIV